MRTVEATSITHLDRLATLSSLDESLTATVAREGLTVLSFPLIW
jgi:hypothetical protein